MLIETFEERLGRAAYEAVCGGNWTEESLGVRQKYISQALAVLDAVIPETGFTTLYHGNKADISIQRTSHSK